VFVLVKWGIRSKSRSDNITPRTRLLRRDHEENIHAWSVCTQPWSYDNVSTSAWSLRNSRVLGVMLSLRLLLLMPHLTKTNTNKLFSMLVFTYWQLLLLIYLMILWNSVQTNLKIRKTFDNCMLTIVNTNAICRSE
jgi:IS4 transposase